jgi:hypothetical protein
VPAVKPRSIPATLPARPPRTMTQHVRYDGVQVVLITAAE